MLDSASVTIGLPLVNAIMMCGIGLTLRPVDFGDLGRRPKPVLCGLAGQYLVLPALGFAFASLFAGSYEHAVGFVLLAACPSASVSNVLTFLARGNVALAVVLTAISAVLALASIPAMVMLATWWFAGDAQAIRLPVGSTVAHLAAIVLVPVAMGMAIRRGAPRFARRAEPWIGRVTLGFLLFLILIIAMENLALVRASLGRLGVPTVAMCTLAIASGLLIARLGRLPVRDAVTIGIEVGVQNCMLALLVALKIMRNLELAMPAALYGLTMFVPAFVLVCIGRRLTSPDGARGRNAGVADGRT